MTPILLVFFAVPPAAAVATDLWFAALTKIVGGRVHHAAGQVDWQVVRRLWLGSLPAALCVVLLISLGVAPGRVGWLTQVIGGVVVMTSVVLLASPWLFALARSRRLGDPVRFKALQPVLTVICGASLGLLVALTSVGAGALGSVMLLYLYPLRMKPHRLVATDIVHAVPLAMVAGGGYLLAGLVDWAMLLSLLAGSLPSVVIGGLLSRRLAGRRLQVVLALVLLAVGVKTLG